MSTDPRQVPDTTREFLALWNDAVEEHLVRQLTQTLPALAREPGLEDSAQVTGLARHLVRALRLAALSGDTAAAVRHLADAVEVGEPEPTV